jgi:hypothetical protein
LSSSSTKDHPLQQESPSSSSPSSSSRCPSVSSHERDYTTRSVPTSTSSNSSSHCPAAPRRSCQAGRDNPSNEHGDHEHHHRPPSHASHIIFRYATIVYSLCAHTAIFYSLCAHTAIFYSLCAQLGLTAPSCRIPAALNLLALCAAWTNRAKL